MGTSARVPNGPRVEEEDDPFKVLAVNTTYSRRPVNDDDDPFRVLASKQLREAEDLLNEKREVRFVPPEPITKRATDALAAYRTKNPVRRDVLPPRREDDRATPLDEIVRSVREGMGPPTAPPPTTFVGKVADAAGRMAAHPIETAVGLVKAPVEAAFKLGEYTRQEIAKGDASRRGEAQDGPGIVTPGKDVVTGKDAAAAAAQLVAIGGAGMTEAAIERGLLRRGFSEHAAVIAAKGAVGAGVGATFTPEDPAVGATLGGLLGAIHPRTARRQTAPVERQLAERGIPAPRAPLQGEARLAEDPFKDLGGPDYEVTGNQPPAAPQPVRSTRPREYAPTSAENATPEQAQVRTVVDRLKRADPEAVTIAADEMAQRVPKGAILVPLPDRSGSTRANAALAQAIAQRTGVEVFDVLARNIPVASSDDRRTAGLPGLTADEHAASFIQKAELPEGRIVFVDDMETTGSTAEGARRALRRDADLLVFAQSAVPLHDAPAQVSKPMVATTAPNVVTPRDISFVPGDQEVVSLSDGRDLQVEYAVVDADDIIASHHALTFQPRPDYPAGVQGRAYHDARGLAAREAVAQQTTNLKPGILLDFGSSAENGPPLVTPDGFTIAGNQRLMMLQRAPTVAPERFEAYKAELAKRSYKFGITTSSWADMKRPILVRRLIDPSIDSRDPIQLADLNRVSDTPAAKSKDVLSEAASRAGALEQAPHALRHFSETFNPEQSIREYMSGADGKEFAKRLVTDGVILPQEVGRYINPATGNLTEPGAHLVEAMMKVAAVKDIEAVASAPPSVLRQLDHSLPAITQSNTIPGYELASFVADALKIAHGARANGSSIEDFLSQRDVFGRGFSQEGMHLARFLEDTSKQKTTTAFRKYATLATEARSSGESVDAFGYQPDDRSAMIGKLFEVSYPGDADGVAEEQVAFGSAAEHEAVTESVEKILAANYPLSEDRLAQVKPAKRGRGWIDLRGQMVTNAADLHALLSVYRHPTVEIMHVILVDDAGQILSHTAETSGSLVATALPDPAAIAKRAARVGATKVILAHNHPSGNPSPSDFDVKATEQLGAALGQHGLEVVGHMVIDHVDGTWLYPTPAGVKGRVYDVPDAPESSWVTAHESGLPKVNSTSAVLAVMARVAVPDGVTVVYMDQRRRIVAVEPRPPKSAAKVANWLGPQMKAHGAASVALSAPPSEAATLRREITSQQGVAESTWARQVVDVIEARARRNAPPQLTSSAQAGRFTPTTDRPASGPPVRLFDADRGAGSEGVLLPAAGPRADDPSAEGRLVGDQGQRGASAQGAEPGREVAASAHDHAPTGDNAGRGLDSPGESGGRPTVDVRGRNGVVAEPPDLFGNPDETDQQIEREKESRAQDSFFMFGNDGSRNLASTEAASRSEIGKLRDELPVIDSSMKRAKDPAEKAKLAMRRRQVSGRIAELERLVNRNKAIGADELQARAAADEVRETDEPFDARRVTESPAFRNWFRESKVVDKDGKPLTVYHGAQRSDRFGPVLLKKRATSGPMPFFTDDPAIASKYSTAKADTSIGDEEGNYEAWYRLKLPGERKAVNLARAWWRLTPEQRATVSALAPRVTFDPEGSGRIELGDEGLKTGTGGYDQHIKEARGNHFQALVEEWLSSGNLFDDEFRFHEVLKLAGVPTGMVEFHDPHASLPGVTPVFLSIQRPLVTSEIGDDLVETLEKASRRQRQSRQIEGRGDAWSKDKVTADDWMDRLKDDLANQKNSHAWTQIPDWVTKTLKGLGYDGIHDTGGKMGGDPHTVWIPFEPGQVKSAIANRGTFDLESANILREPDDLFTYDAPPKVDMNPSAKAAFEAAARDIDFDGSAAKEIGIKRGPWIDRLNRFADALSNGLGPIERLGSLPDVDSKLPPQKNPRDLLSLMKSSDHTVRRFFDEGIVDPITRESRGPSFKSLFAPFKGDVEQIRDALTFAVSERIVGRGLKGVGGDEERFNRAKLIVTEGRKDPALLHFKEQWAEYVDGLGQYAVRSGLWTEQFWAKLKASDALYVRFRRLLEEDVVTAADVPPPNAAGAAQKRTVNVGPGVARFQGSKRTIQNPAEALAEYTAALVRRADRYRVGASLFDVADALGDVKGVIIQRLSSADAQDKFGPQITARARANARAMGLDEAAIKELVESFDVKAFDPDTPIIWRNTPDGKREYAEVSSADLWRAVAALNAADDWAMRKVLDLTLRPLKRLFVAATTGINPRFSLATNLLRDVVDAQAKTQTGMRPQEIVKGYAEAAKGIFSKSELQKIADAHGLGDVSLFAQETKAPRVTRRFAPTSTSDKVKNAIEKVNPLGVTVRGLERLGNASDKAPRLGEFAGAMRTYQYKVESGQWTEVDRRMRAATLARAVTIDFSSKPGSAALRFVSDYVPFFGVSLAAPVVMGRAIGRNPKRVAGVAAGIAMLALLAWALKRRRGDDVAEMIDDRPSTERSGFILFPVDDEGSVLRLPVGQEFGLITSSVTAALDKFAGEDPHAGRLVAQAIVRALPVGISEIAEGRPPIAVPGLQQMAESWANKRTYDGRPVVPSRLQSIPVSERRYDTTSPTYDVMAAVVRKVTPFNEVSALDAENFTRGILSNASSLLTTMTDPIASKIADRPVPGRAERSLSQHPLNPLSAVYKKGAPATTESENDYYAIRDVADQAVTYLRRSVKAKVEPRLDDDQMRLIQPSVSQFFKRIDDQLEEMSVAEQRIRAAITARAIEPAVAQKNRQDIRAMRQQLLRAAVKTLRENGISP